MRKPLLQEADEALNGSREDSYGCARVNLERTALMWSAILGVRITYEQVAQCMVAVKLSRICASPGHRDSWIDIAGYAGAWDKASREG